MCHSEKPKNLQFFDIFGNLPLGKVDINLKFNYFNNYKIMSEKELSHKIESQITPEEQELSEKSEEADGESGLSREDYIRLIALRYMRGSVVGNKANLPLSETDATRLATIERDIDEAGSEANIDPEALKERMELRRKL